MPTSFPRPVVDLLAAVFLSHGGTNAAVDAAIRGLEAGLDSPTLRIIASLSGWTNPFELEAMARTLLDELRLPLPDRDALVRAIAEPVAQSFLAGEIGPEEFVERLYHLSQEVKHAGHHPWCQLHDDWTLARDGTRGSEADVIRRMHEEAARLLKIQ